MSKVNAEGFFYRDRHALTLHAARKVLAITGDLFGKQTSAMDVGCGVGTWLYAAQEQGASRILGIEGPWVEKEAQFAVPREAIRIVNLEEQWEAPGEFDLSICLEVAEHLTPEAGRRLVSRLCGASMMSLFSAAVPGQGGNGHINEQWPQYWQKLFAEHGFRAIDCIRGRIWDDDRIPWWYRQNIVLFANERLAARHYQQLAAAGAVGSDQPILGVIHPEIRRIRPRGAKRYIRGIVRRLKKLWQ